jgi:outer membrane lipoprotein-sorting protein
MKRKVGIACIVLLSILPALPGAAQDSGLSAIDILNRVDDMVNGAKDQSYTMKIVLVDKNGAEKTQELLMLQKGKNKRLAKILSPASQKGIGFLSLPDDVQYLYLPAFGKAQRIASNIKLTSFAGTDFTYEDMGTGSQADRWDPKIVQQDQNATVLEMTPKPGASSDYSRILMWIRPDSFVAVRVEYYDKGGKLLKILVREKLQRVQGYWVAMETTMEDVKKRHKTKMIISDMKFDTGLPDERFTDRSMGQ